MRTTHLTDNHMCNSVFPESGGGSREDGVSGDSCTFGVKFGLHHESVRSPLLL